jgi:3-oxoacyl-[acyl-carrier-protein] synthase-3
VQRCHLPHPDYPHIRPGTILFPNEGGIDRAFLRRPVEVARSALEAAGVTIDDVEWLVTHQPRMDMLLYTRAELGVSPERHYINVDRYGNTTTASIPICLTELIDSGRLRRGQRILMLGMGAGFQVAAHVLRF